MLSVLPIFAHSRFEMLSARSKQARPKSWPPQCDIKQLLRDPPSAHLSPDVLTYKESSFPTRGGLLFEVEGSVVYGMCGKGNRDSSFTKPSFP